MPSGTAWSKGLAVTSASTSWMALFPETCQGTSRAMKTSQVSTCHWALSHQAHNVLISEFGSLSRRAVEHLQGSSTKAFVAQALLPYQCYGSSSCDTAVAVVPWGCIVWFHGML